MIGYRFISNEEYELLKNNKTVYGQCEINPKLHRNNHISNGKNVACFFTGNIILPSDEKVKGIPCWHGDLLIKVDIPDDSIVSCGYGAYAEGIYAEEFTVNFYNHKNLIDIITGEIPEQPFGYYDEVTEESFQGEYYLIL